MQTASLYLSRISSQFEYESLNDRYVLAFDYYLYTISVRFVYLYLPQGRGAFAHLDFSPLHQQSRYPHVDSRGQDQFPIFSINRATEKRHPEMRQSFVLIPD